MNEVALAPAMPQTGAVTYSSARADAKNFISWTLDSFSTFVSTPIREIGIGHSCANSPCDRRSYRGIDIDPRSVELARERLPQLDFQVVDITGPEIVAFARERRFWTIVCLNVIEHIADNATAVINLARAPEPGGHLLIIVPALQLLYNDLDRLAATVTCWRTLHHSMNSASEASSQGPKGAATAAARSRIALRARRRVRARHGACVSAPLQSAIHAAGSLRSGAASAYREDPFAGYKPQRLSVLQADRSQ